MAKSRIISYCLLTFFVALTIVWLVQFNCYQVLYFQEQTQLFRFNWFYFNTFLLQPGGLTSYLGAFLTQFNFYPWVGASILSCMLAGKYRLFDSICRPNVKPAYLFVLSFIPVLLWLMALASQLFLTSYLIGVIIALVGFRIYLSFKAPVRYLK